MLQRKRAARRAALLKIGNQQGLLPGFPGLGFVAGRLGFRSLLGSQFLAFLAGFEQGRGLGFGDGAIFVGLGRDHVFTGRLAFGFLFGTGDIDRHHHGDVGVQLDAHVVDAQRLDRRIQHDLRAGNRSAAGRHDVGDVAGRDRTVELTALAGLADHDEAFAVDRFTSRGSFRSAFGVTLFQRFAFGFETGQVGFGGAQRLFLRQQEVAGEAVFDSDFIADMAVPANALEQNDFHWITPGCPGNFPG